MEIIKFEELENRLVKYQDKYILVDRNLPQLYRGRDKRYK